GWYLVGRDVDADDSRVFRISRIRGAVAMATPRSSGAEYDIPTTFDPESEFSADAFGGKNGRFENVVVRFDRQVAFIVANEFQGIYEIKELKNGSLELHLPKVWPGELMRLLGEFPGHWKILIPSDAARHIQSQLKAALKQYRKRFKAGASA
ncbi:MAG: helix-turn-helix transcriptional regulator, partial [Planctomycetota bacterium]